MDKFLKKWNNHTFEDWGSVTSDDYVFFAQDFRSYLKRNLPIICEVVNFTTGHYDHSCFIRCEDNHIYLSYSWDRYSPVDINKTGPRDGVLVRFAKNDKDYKGETNRFTSLCELPDCLIKMFVERSATC